MSTTCSSAPRRWWIPPIRPHSNCRCARPRRTCSALIAPQARPAVRPDDPRTLRVELPQEPRRVRDDVQTDLNMMFLLLGGLSRVVGALGIANIALVGVMERTAAIGLRGAIGATRRH